ncbi:hypothetical protein WMY93_026214 [Mugilogobius chulae]|uniref:Uncharacterized protein n=1 Tax=Mugilogobius chulae TaxID=88201 RepID=A0AAW0N7T2_9GOBI
MSVSAGVRVQTGCGGDVRWTSRVSPDDTSLRAGADWSEALLSVLTLTLVSFVVCRLERGPFSRSSHWSEALLSVLTLTLVSFVVCRLERGPSLGPHADSYWSEALLSVLTLTLVSFVVCRLERGPSLGPQCRLQLEECLSADQEPTPELIQGYVKKHVQDAADQGVMFVGFIQEASGGPLQERHGRSLTVPVLHSSPSSILDLQSRTLESVFIFQEPAEAEAGAQAYDAIVVEQWTVIHGLQIKADYVPLLQSLASFGWRLTCVLPTPVVRTNSDGSLSTKQIVFLQRPVLSRKKRDSKKLIFKARNKSNKNCIKDTAKTKKKTKKADKPESETADRTDEANAERDADPETAEVRAEKQPETKDAEDDNNDGKKQQQQVVENGLDTEPEPQSSASNEILTKEEQATNQSAAVSQEE